MAMPSDEMSSEQIGYHVSAFRAGINVVEDEESEENSDEDGKAKSGSSTSKTNANSDEDLGRTDDPVRMYCEMGTVELLSREGEIEIAKRIEAGRESMISGLYEARSHSGLSSAGEMLLRMNWSCCAILLIWMQPMAVPLKTDCRLWKKILKNSRMKTGQMMTARMMIKKTTAMT